MGWNNPNVPWSELERALSGRPPQARPWSAAGGPAPAAPQTRTRGAAAAHRARHPHALRRAALPLRVQLPGRRVHPGAAGRRGGPARAWTPWRSPITTASTASSGSPRRRARPGCAPCTARNCPWACPSRSWASPTRSVSTCWCWPGVRRATTGCPMQISRAQLAGGEKGRPVYDLDDAGRRRRRHWLILTGCRKGGVRRALTAARPGPGPRRDPRADGPVRPAQRRRRAHHRAAAHRRRGQRRPRRPRRRSWGCRWSPPPARTTPPRPTGRVAAAMAAVRGQAQPGRGGPLPAARTRGAPAVRRGDGRPVRPVPDRGADRRRHRRRSARSTCIWSRRNCRPTTCRPATTRTPTCGSSPWPGPPADTDRRRAGRTPTHRSKRNCGSSPS